MTNYRNNVRNRFCSYTLSLTNTERIQASYL